VVDHHRRQRRRRVEEAAVDDDDPDVPRPDAGLGERAVDGAEHDGLRLGARLRHARVGRRVEHRAGEVGALAQPGPLQDLALERQVVVREHARGRGLAHEGLPRHGVRGGGLVAREVQQVDRPRAAREVGRGEDGGEAEEGGEEREVGFQSGAERRRGEAAGRRGEAVREEGDERGQQDVVRVGDGEVVRQLQPGRAVAGVRNRLRDAAAGGFVGAHGARGESSRALCVVVRRGARTWREQAGGCGWRCGRDLYIYVEVRPRAGKTRGADEAGWVQPPERPLRETAASQARERWWCVVLVESEGVGRSRASD
jgi:hypothetical protein